MRRSFSFFPKSFSRWALAALACTAATALAAPLITSLSTEERRNLQRETLVLIEFLQGYHYSDRPFHEVNSAELLERYFSTLDPNDSIFLKGDTEFLRRRFERNLKTVYLFKGDLHPAFEIYDLFARRMLERCTWIDARLNQSFAMERDGTFDPNPSDSTRPADAKTADELWEKILHNELIQERLRGHDQVSAIDELRQRYREMRKRVESADPLRVREYFLNALMGLFDPHCGYFSRETADEVSDDLTGAVSGIGVDLRLSEGRFLVKSLQPGGPAERAGGISPGDEFLGVGDVGGNSKRLVNRRLREVVELIRGKPGTQVEIIVRPADGSPERAVVLERSRMEIAENHASGWLFRVPDETGKLTQVGLVTLPAFYGDRDEKTTTSSMTKDVAELLAKFRERGAEAVIVDVRDNGGGLIDEAVGLTGLFIEKGPALLTRGQTSKPTILRDDDPAIAFSGPLVVLTSRHSASASEGFAGAMQAYRRAVIIGDTATFGKGTMQWFVELSKAGGSIPEAQRAQWGVARVTREFFYCPDGNSPQFDGVISDVALPVSAPPGDVRERDLPHALPHTKIPTPEPLDTTGTNVSRVTPGLLAQLKTASDARVAQLPEFALETRANKLRERLWKTGPRSLRLSERQAEYDEISRDRVALRRERRELDATAAFAVERVDLEIVVTNRRSHQATLLAKKTGHGEPLANRLEGETFYYRAADDADLRAIAIGDIDWEVALSKSGILAETWAQASGDAVDEPALRAALTSIKLRDPDSPKPTSIVSIFQQHLGNSLENQRLQASIGALLKHVAENDVDVLLDQRPLDVHLRESLRLAADWARKQGKEVAPPVTPAP